MVRVSLSVAPEVLNEGLQRLVEMIQESRTAA
jgi:hypothetical protein